MSMCLLRLPLLLFLARNVAAELSQKILNDLEKESITLNPEIQLLSHTSCEVASKQESNLASIVEVTVKVFLTLLKEIAPPSIIKIYPDVDL